MFFLADIFLGRENTSLPQNPQYAILLPEELPHTQENADDRIIYPAFLGPDSAEYSPQVVSTSSVDTI
jgi:hypothetical protein